MDDIVEGLECGEWWVRERKGASPAPPVCMHSPPTRRAGRVPAVARRGGHRRRHGVGTSRVGAAGASPGHPPQLRHPQSQRGPRHGRRPAGPACRQWEHRAGLAVTTPHAGGASAPLRAATVAAGWGQGASPCGRTREPTWRTPYVVAHGRTCRSRVGPGAAFSAQPQVIHCPFRWPQVKAVKTFLDVSTPKKMGLF